MLHSLCTTRRRDKVAYKIVILNYKEIITWKTSMPSTNDDDPYAHAAKGLLKLKNDQGVSKKKKNKEGKKKKLVEVTKIGEEEESKTTEMKRTNAEIAFQKMQEKMQTERIKQKASMTHKQRVEEFNRHLDSLTEHFDIPKVSWTK